METVLKLEDGTEIPIEKVSVLRLQPGDYLVLRTDNYMTQEAVACLQESAEAAFPEAKGRVRVIDGGLAAEVLRPETVEAAADAE